MFFFIGCFTQTVFFCSVKYLLLQSCLKLFDLLGMRIILLNLLLQSCFQVLDLLGVLVVLLNLFFHIWLQSCWVCGEFKQCIFHFFGQERIVLSIGNFTHSIGCSEGILHGLRWHRNLRLQISGIKHILYVRLS